MKGNCPIRYQIDQRWKRNKKKKLSRKVEAKGTFSDFFYYLLKIIFTHMSFSEDRIQFLVKDSKWEGNCRCVVLTKEGNIGDLHIKNLGKEKD